MTALWGLIDARSLRDPGLKSIVCHERIAGLSLLARHARLAARCGLAGVVVHVAAEEDARALAAGLRQTPPPPGFDMEYLLGLTPLPEDRDYIRLELAAVYTAAALSAAQVERKSPAALARIVSHTDCRVVEARLYEHIRKSIDHDGVIAYYTQRPLSRQITRLLINTPITPNQVTLVAMMLGVAAAACAGIGTPITVALAGFCYWLGAVVDCVDGEIARLRVEGSKLGEWLDTLADDVATYGLVAGIGIGLSRSGDSAIWAQLGIACAVIGALMQAKVYADLHRLGLPIDTAQYPWFFGTPSKASERNTSSFRGKLFYWLAFLFRRDAFVTIVALLLIAQKSRAALIFLASGIAVVLGFFIVHHLVQLGRGTRPQ